MYVCIYVCMNVLDVVYVMESMGLAYAITNSNSNSNISGFKNKKVPDVVESQRFKHTYLLYIHTYIDTYTYIFFFFTAFLLWILQSMSY